MVSDLADVMNFVRGARHALSSAVFAERVTNELQGTHAPPVCVVAALAGRKASVSCRVNAGLRWASQRPLASRISWRQPPCEHCRRGALAVVQPSQSGFMVNATF